MGFPRTLNKHKYCVIDGVVTHDLNVINMVEKKWIRRPGRIKRVTQSVRVKRRTRGMNISYSIVSPQRNINRIHMQYLIIHTIKPIQCINKSRRQRETPFTLIIITETTQEFLCGERRSTRQGWNQRSIYFKFEKRGRRFHDTFIEQVLRGG